MQNLSPPLAVYTRNPKNLWCKQTGVNTKQHFHRSRDAGNLAQVVLDPPVLVLEIEVGRRSNSTSTGYWKTCSPLNRCCENVHCYDRMYVRTHAWFITAPHWPGMCTTPCLGRRSSSTRRRLHRELLSYEFWKRCMNGAAVGCGEAEGGGRKHSSSSSSTGSSVGKEAWVTDGSGLISMVTEISSCPQPSHDKHLRNLFPDRRDQSFISSMAKEGGGLYDGHN